MADWLIIVLAIAALWLLWQMLNLVSDMLEIWHAGLRAEDMSANKERDKSSSWR
jgi:hypothetical protein